MSKLDNYQPTPDTKLTLSFTKIRIQRLTLAIALLGMGGCATTPQIRPNIESHDISLKQIMLRVIGVAKNGSQLDGSEVQFGEGATKEEAEENAKAVIEMLMGEGTELSYKPSQAIKLPDGTYLVCVKGEKKLPKMNPETKKKMIKYKQMVIHYLNEKLNEYKKKYGNRKEFPVFKTKVQEKISVYKNHIKDLKEGRINSGHITIIGPMEEVASGMAEMLISMASNKAKLLNRSEKIEEARNKLNRKMRK